MTKKLHILCLALGLSLSALAVTHNITVDAVGNPSKIAFSVTEVLVASTDTVRITNNTNAPVSLGIEGVPFSLPLPAGNSFSYSPPTSGYGTVKVTLTSLSGTPSNNIPLILKEPTNETPLDTDKDGIPDVAEVIAGTDPLSVDSDEDGVNDGVEVGLLGFDADTSSRTNPLDPDTDDGGLLDGVEDLNGNGKVDALESDPLNPADDIVTSINNSYIQKENLQIYPQPASGSVFVKESGLFTILNHTGSQILTGTVTDQKINVEALHTGIYHLILNGKSQKLMIK